jgi:hypothetical protein
MFQSDELNWLLVNVFKFRGSNVLLRNTLFARLNRYVYTSVRVIETAQDGEDDMKVEQLVMRDE